VFDIGKMVEVLAERGPFAFIVVDTSAAYFPGDDEINNVQAGNYARALRAHLTTLPGNPCVLVLCHPIKAPKSQSDLLPRGGGAFLNEVDGNLTLWSEDGLRTIELSWTGKFRGPSFEPIQFKLQRIESPELVNSKGVMIPTVRVVPVSEQEAEDMARSDRQTDDQLLIAMSDNPGASVATLARACGWIKNGRPQKSKVQRIVARLARHGLVATVRGVVALTEAGRKAVKEARAAATDGFQARPEEV
jgi:hypothetical protein